MTAIVINGQSYDLDEGLAGAELNHLLFLKQRTGLGLKTITTKLQSFGDVDKTLSKQEQTLAVLGALDDEETLNSFRAIVWLLRTKAGDRDEAGLYLTIDAANEGVSLADFGSADEPAATNEEQADPTSLAAAPDDAPAS
ncbi:hypothetical protein [Curtobacterium oceanosedimentum]|uniref:hypothetical protein n=1 Tax=Curtobacterium oceanosedimentum TaxID=465820 RepID=UPI00339B70D6